MIPHIFHKNKMFVKLFKIQDSYQLTLCINDTHSTWLDTSILMPQISFAETNLLIDSLTVLTPKTF